MYIMHMHRSANVIYRLGYIREETIYDHLGGYLRELGIHLGLIVEEFL